MGTALFKAGQFAGVPANDTFALAALRQSPVIFPLPAIPWPNNLQPTSVSLGNYAPGTKITGPLSAEADVLVILYTEQETTAFLDVFTCLAENSQRRQSAVLAASMRSFFFLAPAIRTEHERVRHFHRCGAWQQVVIDPVRE